MNVQIAAKLNMKNEKNNMKQETVFPKNQIIEFSKFMLYPLILVIT